MRARRFHWLLMAACACAFTSSEASIPRETFSQTPDRNATEQRYDAAGDLVQTIGPRGAVSDSEYDARGRKVKAWLPVSDYVEENGTLVSGGSGTRSFIQTGYDRVGNPVRVTDARGNATVTFYDAANRAVASISPAVGLDDPLLGAGVTTTFPAMTMLHDGDGNILETWLGNAPGQASAGAINPLRRTALNTYTANNELATATDAENITVTNGYDGGGNLELVTDGKLQKTKFEFDGLGRNTRITYGFGTALAETLESEYDAMNKTARVDGMGRRTEYDYDPRHRLSKVRYIGRAQDNLDYSYRKSGGLLAVTHATPDAVRDVAYGLDRLDRRERETSAGVTHHSVFDVAGNTLSVTYAEGTASARTLISSYDPLERLDTVTENGRATTYRYDRAGNIRRRDMANGELIAQSYDALNRKTAITAPAYTYSQRYDLAGNLRRIDESYPANPALNRIVVNTYDGVNRLKQEYKEHGLSAVATSYRYDNANNRIENYDLHGSYQTSMGRYLWQAAGFDEAEYHYNELNQLNAVAEWGFVHTTYGYDSAGNRTSRNGGGKDTTNIYDYDNRLIGVAETSNSQLSVYAYAYDYRTRRVLRNENAAETKVVFSGGTSIREYSQPSTLNPQLSVEFIRGSDYGGGIGGILYSLRGGTPSFTHYNSRGDVTAKIDSTGAVTYQATYEAFGERPQEIGTTLDRQKANTKEEDPTGLLNEGFRYRDLETGMFITRDPAGFVDGPNLYTYVNQNPWTKFDPEGLAVKKELQESLKRLDDAEDNVIKSYQDSEMSDSEKKTAIKQVKKEYQSNREKLEQRISNIETSARILSKASGATIEETEKELDDRPDKDGVEIIQLVQVEKAGAADAFIHAYRKEYGQMALKGAQEFSLRQVTRVAGGVLGIINKKPGKLGEFKGRDALRAENRVARDAANKAGLDKDQARQLHDEISGNGFSYQKILEIAKDIKAGN